MISFKQQQEARETTKSKKMKNEKKKKRMKDHQHSCRSSCLVSHRLCQYILNAYCTWLSSLILFFILSVCNALWNGNVQFVGRSLDLKLWKISILKYAFCTHTHILCLCIVYVCHIKPFIFSRLHQKIGMNYRDIIKQNSEM